MEEEEEEETPDARDEEEMGKRGGEQIRRAEEEEGGKRISSVRGRGRRGTQMSKAREGRGEEHISLSLLADLSLLLIFLPCS